MKSSTVLLLLASVAVLGYCSGDRRRLAIERGRAIQQRVDTLTVEVRRTDTVYRQTVRTLTKTLAYYDTARVTDTVTVVRDSVQVVYVSRETADSAVNVCRRLILTCEARVAATDSLVNGLREQVRWERSQRPGFLSTWSWRLGMLGLGYAIGK